MSCARRWYSIRESGSQCAEGAATRQYSAAHAVWKRLHGHVCSCTGTFNIERMGLDKSQTGITVRNELGRR